MTERGACVKNSESARPNKPVFPSPHSKPRKLKEHKAHSAQEFIPPFQRDISAHLFIRTSFSRTSTNHIPTIFSNPHIRTSAHPHIFFPANQKQPICF